MLRNHIKIAFRNLIKNKVFSTINILGLVVGISVTILIALWVNDEISRDNYFQNKSKIAQVFQHQTNNGIIKTVDGISIPLEAALRNKYNDSFEHIVLSSRNLSMHLQYKDLNISFSGNFMQREAPDLLNLKIIKGKEDGLKEINNIMISETVAKTLFGNENPIGKILNIGSNVSVSAVYKDLPSSSSFSELQFLSTWDYYADSQGWIKYSKNNWGMDAFHLYVEINENTTMDAVTSKIIDVKKQLAPNQAEFNPQIFLLPMKDWYLRSNFENGVQTGGRIENVWLFGIIGFFVLLLACINFVNLSTAKSEKRGVEVGVRKSIGSSRLQLITQFLSESFLIVFISFFLSFGLVLLCLNGFNNLAGKSIQFPYQNINFWLISITFINVTSLLAGCYPAFYLSSFKPVTVLKGKIIRGRYASLPRKILVVGQFTVSITLIIGTLVVINQIDFAKDRNAGYNKEGLVQIPAMGSEFRGKSDVMRNKFIKSGAVTNMATASGPATQVWSNRSGFSWEGKTEGFQENFAFTEVSYEFVETLGLKIIDGRGFSRDFPSDSTAVILNKTAVAYMGLKNPVGKFIRYSSNDSRPPLKIVGVVNDVIMQSPYKPVKQTMFVFDANENIAYYNLRLNESKSVSANLGLIEQLFKENFPNLPFTYQFIDEQYGQKFKTEERVANLSKLFTLLAIFISCLGLFGLASFLAEQRTKEIGIRKTLGASVSQLWVLLSKDFVKLVVISLIIGSPIAFYMMTQWLQKFPYRTDISWTVFVIASSGALIITLITVSYQAIKSALANPVNSLKTE